MMRSHLLAAVSHDTQVGVGGPACVGLEERRWGGRYGVIYCVCVCVCARAPVCDIVENPPKRFPVGLHYQASLIDQLFPPTSCLSSSPSTRLPLPHSSQSHESPLPQRGQGLDRATSCTPITHAHSGSSVDVLRRAVRSCLFLNRHAVHCRSVARIITSLEMRSSDQ